ncbi:hypothetical protein [Streptomyces sp. CAU 1734]|uniref:hypothetical protein n=1 Tax=Streptomyces sp. CAU 1734 TaxID=3140360 RepID=UPI00326008DB
MRLYLTDGTRTVDIRAHDRTPLADLESTAHRLLTALRPDPDEPPNPIGFAGARRIVDLYSGVSLSSDTERAPDPDDEYDPDDDE